MNAISRKESRAQRHSRIRRKVAGTAERPRMAVLFSNRRIYIQFIDDEAGRTLAAVQSAPEAKALNVELARKTGARAADVARAQGITAVVFDRSGFRYHGRMKALADAAREAGLRF